MRILRPLIICATLTLLCVNISPAGTVGDINNDGQIDLTEAIYALQVSSGAYPNINPSCQLTGKGTWTGETEYMACDVVTYDGSTYACSMNHISSDFVSEMSNWVLLTQTGPQGLPGVSPNQQCPGTSPMIGIDDAGQIICRTKTVFVSSDEVDGTLGFGSSGQTSYFNSYCNYLSDAAGLSGIYKAWISDSAGNSPSVNFTKPDLAYLLTDGTLVAANYVDLTDGRIETFINVDENGETVPGGPVWTGTHSGGNPSGHNCGSWSDNTSLGAIGHTAPSFDSAWSYNINNFLSCSELARVYCFEQ